MSHRPLIQESAPLAGLVTRRDLLRVGSLSIAATAVPASQLLRAARPRKPEKSRSSRADSVILLWMAGGVTHIDSFDPKPAAPVEVRGVLHDIPTTLPGVRFSETIPELARITDKFALVRSYSHDSNDHLQSQAYTLSGRKVGRNELFSEPNIGSMVSHLQGPRQGLPGYIAVPGITRPGPPPHNLFVGGWLGRQYVPYCLGGLPPEPDFTVGEKMDDPSANIAEDLTPRSLSLTQEVPLARLNRRAGLRKQFDQALRRLEGQNELNSLESRYQDALQLLNTPRIRSAFDVGRETVQMRDAYGRTKIGGRCLMARRLVEAGARFVMVDYGYDSDYGNVWDNHNAPSQNHPPIQQMCKRGYHLAGMDRAFAALISDLETRGMLDRTLVVFLTEFGRTPKINANGGRDHWGAAGSIFFAGGGVRGGQVIGATDNQAAAPVTRPVTPADVAATMYAGLGINPRGLVEDILQRPRLVLERGRPIAELF